MTRNEARPLSLVQGKKQGKTKKCGRPSIRNKLATFGNSRRGCRPQFRGNCSMYQTAVRQVRSLRESFGGKVIVSATCRPVEHSAAPLPGDRKMVNSLAGSARSACRSARVVSDPTRGVIWTPSANFARRCEKIAAAAFSRNASSTWIRNRRFEHLAQVPGIHDCRRAGGATRARTDLGCSGGLEQYLGDFRPDGQPRLCIRHGDAALSQLPASAGPLRGGARVPVPLLPALRCKPAQGVVTSRSTQRS